MVMKLFQGRWRGLRAFSGNLLKKWYFTNDGPEGLSGGSVQISLSEVTSDDD
jgi:hypothetical protein